jgi:sulfoxide reductase heme-binding subunit YedZ
MLNVQPCANAALSRQFIAMNRTQVINRVAKPTVFLALLAPFIIMVFHAATGGLSANPIEDVLHRSGLWGLRILLLSLAITPLKRLFGWNVLIRFRRMVGLFAFFYLVLHFSIYLGLDRFFSIDDIVEDIAVRPFITVGFTSLLLLLPLAVTSTKKMVKRLGGKRWTRLHRLVYPAAVGGVIHFIWAVKLDNREPTVYAVLLGILLTLRVPMWIEQARRG